MANPRYACFNIFIYRNQKREIWQDIRKSSSGFRNFFSLLFFFRFVTKPYQISGKKIVHLRKPILNIWRDKSVLEVVSRFSTLSRLCIITELYFQILFFQLQLLSFWPKPFFFLLLRFLPIFFVTYCCSLVINIFAQTEKFYYPVGFASDIGFCIRCGEIG